MSAGGGYDVAWKDRPGLFTQSGAPTATATTSPISPAASSRATARRWRTSRPSSTRTSTATAPSGPLRHRPPTTIIEPTASTTLRPVRQRLLPQSCRAAAPSRAGAEVQRCAGDSRQWAGLGADRRRAVGQRRLRRRLENTATGLFHIWSTDSNGNYITNLASGCHGQQLDAGELRDHLRSGPQRRRHHRAPSTPPTANDHRSSRRRPPCFSPATTTSSIPSRAAPPHRPGAEVSMALLSPSAVGRLGTGWRRACRRRRLRRRLLQWCHRALQHLEHRQQRQLHHQSRQRYHGQQLDAGELRDHLRSGPQRRWHHWASAASAAKPRSKLTA